MKQTLVIGSAVVDIMINLPRLPVRGEDINIGPPQYSIGGCAYIVFKTLKFLRSPAFLCSPVGSGYYGHIVRENLEAQGITPLVNLEKENGCCYCLVEEDGERSFLSCHGAEYLFYRSWLKDFDFSQSDSAFICGLEVEEETGTEIVDFVYEHTELELFFSPGPRIRYIDPERMEKLLARRDNKGKGPFLHLNETEACSFSEKPNIQAAAEFLSAKTNNALVITLGEKGCFYFDPQNANHGFIPGFPTFVRDTTGAGDAHCGAVIAGLKQGKALAETCEIANRLGAAVVSIQGADLDKLSGIFS